MKMLIKVAITFSVSLILTALLSACIIRFPDDHYSGDYPELFTVAIHSLLGAKGYSVTEIFHEIILWVIDEDSYGRVMFLYVEPIATSTLKFNNIVDEAIREDRFHSDCDITD